jgi:branched-chain amino acid transport system permease protein
VVCLLQETLRTSPLGLSMLVGRFDPPMAGALGVRVPTMRIVAFAFSAVTAALGGALIVQLAGGAFPDQFTTTASINLLIIPIIGGRGWRWAPLVGAIIVIALPEYLRFLDDYRLVVYGALVTAVALFLPGGAQQAFRAGWSRVRSGIRTVRR